MGLTEPQADPRTGWAIQADASPVGAGAILKHRGAIVAYMCHAWEPHDFPSKLGVVIGDPAWQTFFELLTIALALDLWGDWFRQEPCAVVGDNTASLTSLLKQKGKGPLLAVARELSWRRARRGWLISAGHLPTEGNTVPDTLSRVPEGATFPHDALATAIQTPLPLVCRFWRCLDEKQ